MSSVNGLLAALLLCAGAEGSTLAFSASDGRSATLVMAGQDVFSFASGALILHLPLEFLDAAPTANDTDFLIVQINGTSELRLSGEEDGASVQLASISSPADGELELCAAEARPTG